MVRLTTCLAYITLALASSVAAGCDKDCNGCPSSADYFGCLGSYTPGQSSGQICERGWGCSGCVGRAALCACQNNCSARKLSQKREAKCIKGVDCSGCQTSVDYCTCKNTCSSSNGGLKERSLEMEEMAEDVEGLEDMAFAA